MFASKKQLAVFLSMLDTFHTPDPTLEQYPTDSEVAASMLWDAYMNDDIRDKHVVDLGAGTGILGIGAMVLGAKTVTFIEIDAKLSPILMENISIAERHMETTYEYDILKKDVKDVTHHADTVVQNPPFGTRTKGADTAFIAAALRIAPRIYTLHKQVTEPYLRRWIESHGGIVQSVRHHSFPLKQSLPRHTRRIHRINVSAMRITRQREQPA